MHSLNSDFNKINFYKSKKFIFKKVYIIKSCKFSCYVKQNYVLDKKKIYAYYYILFRQLESMFGFLPNMKKINLKYTNKKKRLKTRSFLKIEVETRKNFLFFLENFLVKYFYFYFKNLEFLKFKKFNMLKETLLNKINSKIKIKSHSLNFNIFFFKNLLNFSRKFNNKKKKKVIIQKIY